MTGLHRSEVDRGQPSKDKIDDCLARLGISELHKEVVSPCKNTGNKVDCAVAVCSRVNSMRKWMRSEMNCLRIYLLWNEYANIHDEGHNTVAS